MTRISTSVSGHRVMINWVPEYLLCFYNAERKMNRCYYTHTRACSDVSGERGTIVIGPGLFRGC